MRETLNLPQTDFPMRAGLPKREPQWCAHWEKNELYQKLREKGVREGRTPFVLHCGPPYANGNLHMGHALNMVLKDVVVRSQQMMGKDAIFVPGWDCHGLPIEWKIEQELKAKGQDKDALSTASLRALCRDYAAGWVDVQKTESKRLGLMADFDNPYLTMNPKNEAGIVRELGKISGHGLLYKGAKSIMWSTVEQTSLAEAEIEYADKESTAIYVKFDLKDTDNESVVIWTTTPWTIPANQAIAYAKDATYALVQATEVFEKATAEVGDKVWVAKDLLEDFTKMVGFTAYDILNEQQGSDFEGLVATHPLYGRDSVMLEGFHVTTDAGTGFVHTAPSHGAEDFEIGKQFNLDLTCHVKGDGCYDDTVNGLKQTHVTLAGMSIWDAGKLIVEEMTQTRHLMRWYKFKHSYPTSWRSKAPLIFRTVPQWFIALDKEVDGETVRSKALTFIKKIGAADGWIPGYGENRITAMMEGRPDWCISRQRAWGVPITVFRHTPSGEYTFEKEVFDHIADLIAENGIDIWETLATEKLLPAGYLEMKGWQASDLEKETDILDVWFDSGTTYAHVVDDKMHQPLPADLYLEGSDQHRGWFNSSLTACTAARGYAPYKQVLTHGHVVDAQGRKFSKSLGNGVAPNDVMQQFGMDIIRLWVAASDYNEDIRYGDEIMKGVADSYRRYRNTFRYLLSNLYDFEETQHVVAYDDLPELEQWVLARLYQVITEVEEAYQSYQFRKVYEITHNFCAKELSNLYFDVRKDSLYCDPRVSDGDEGYYHRRRSCQTVLMHLLKTLTTYLAPVMPFTCDEVWRSAFGETAEIHLEDFYQMDPAWQNDNVVTAWERIWEVRDHVNLQIEALRGVGKIKANLEAGVKLTLPENMFDWAAVLPWDELLVVSEAYVETGADLAATIRVLADEGYVKCARSWQYMPVDEASVEDGIQVTARDALALRVLSEQKVAS